ncbi:YkvA family protein [Alsobacter sp. R-9]
MAARDPRVPWPAKAVAAIVAAYALSPIDLIPDAVPVLGLLDDLVIVPLGIWLAVRLVPPSIMAECRAEAARREGRPVSRAGAAVIIALWLAGSAAVGWWAVRWWRG